MTAADPGALQSRRFVALALPWAAVAAALAGCGRSDPERELREAFSSMQNALRERRTADVMSHVADDFVQPASGLDRAGLRQLVAGTLLTNPNILLAVTVRELRIDGDRAVARLSVLATGGRGMVPERGQAWDVTTGWRREGGRWRVYSAEWSSPF